ncbi:hypothetical protein [Actinomadura montaniterrae]|uniref:Secreted protein n=1 Tax=Actinomadura montaniterrae TaxID=1803903 RepID=A0A6L3VXL4_9ACTN|nr:hypothetical protein [Actinomadura montaniterrae]KAB2385926.1 hypothetical protein F9B16_08985 [Actinomadura montaniterrae]
MKLRIGRIAAGTMALAAAAIMATAGNASASEPPDGIVWDHTYSYSTVPGVKVYVEEHGDIVSVCDTSANGHSATVRVEDRVGYTYLLVADNGKGSCDSAQASDGGQYNLFEGDTIGLHMTGDGDYSSAYPTFVNDH